MPLAGGCGRLGAELGIAKEPPPQSKSESHRPDPAGMRLAAAAERAEAALTALAGMRAAATPPSVADVPTDLPPELQRTVTVDWIGPVEALVEALARRAGYRFTTAGAPSVRPVMISVTAGDIPLIEVLRDAGLQAGDAATLVVDADRRTMHLDWTAIRPDGAAGDGS